MPASNTKECFREFIGMKLKGVLFSALPLGDKKISNGTKTLIFEDGRGLTISNNGTFWIENKEDVSRAINQRKDELDANKKDIEEVLKLVGEI